MSHHPQCMCQFCQAEDEIVTPVAKLPDLIPLYEDIMRVETVEALEMTRVRLLGKNGVLRDSTSVVRGMVEGWLDDVRRMLAEAYAASHPTPERVTPRHGGFTDEALRDLFAGTAMQALVTRQQVSDYANGLAETAYDMAEAMLAERAKRYGSKP